MNVYWRDGRKTSNLSEKNWPAAAMREQRNGGQSPKRSSSHQPLPPDNRDDSTEVLVRDYPKEKHRHFSCNTVPRYLKTV